MDKRRKQGLCYNCDEKWQLRHKYKGTKVFLLKGLCEEVEHKSGLQLVQLDDDGVTLGTQDQVQGSDNMVTLAEITLYALIGNSSTNTMRVRSRIKNHEVVSLIDSGSTHNFLGNAAKLDMLNLHLDTSQILEVKVADGSVIKTLGICHGVTLAI